MRSYPSISVMAGGLLLVGTTVYAGQQPPPIDGVTGTIASKGSAEQTYRGLHTVAVKTATGFEHLFHWAGRPFEHGGKGGADEALNAFEDGSTVVVRYTANAGHDAFDDADRTAGDDVTGLEGVITKVDYGAKTIAIRLADGSRQTLRLIDYTPTDRVGNMSGTPVVVYSHDAGQRVAHYFTRVS
jgi:hypothetical protein